MLDLFANPPALFLGRIVALVVALSVHEFAHAFAAYHLGDRTAQMAGRLTLNPLAHLDPIGSLAMILVGFGWAKPVPVNPFNLRGNKLRGMAITAAAGPISNVLQAVIFSLPIRLGLMDLDQGVHGPTYLSPGEIIPSFGLVLYLLVWTNLLLAVFNMIPLGPLDGMKVLMGVLPQDMAVRLEPMARYGSLLLLLLMTVGGGLLVRMIFPPAQSMLDLLMKPRW